MRRTVLRLAVIAAVVLPQFPAHATDRVEEQWSLPTNNSGQELLGILLQDDPHQWASRLLGNLQAFSDNQADAKICNSLQDPNCATSRNMFDAFLEPCPTVDAVNCIAGVDAINDSGTVVRGTFTGRRFPPTSGSQFEGSAVNELPAGTSPGAWSFDGVINGAGTNTYVVAAMLSGRRDPNAQKFTFTGYQMRISPFSLKTGDYTASVWTDAEHRNVTNCVERALACGLSLNGSAPTECAAVENGLCALRNAFPAGYRFRLTLRLSQSPTGWFHGRIRQPDVQIQRTANGAYDVGIDGAPVTVPVVGVLEPNASVPAALQVPPSSNGYRSWGEQGPTGRRNMVAVPGPDNDEAFRLYALWQSYIKDHASASPTIWSVRTLTVGGDASKCFRDSSKFLGIVTTNAMIYAPGPPRFDLATQSLDYKVAAPHYRADNGVFEGSYDLQLRSEVARCVYGFSSAPISATVSVVSEAGEQRVATTAVNEKDGWLRLAAYGFTFSTPTVRVKLTQPSPAPTAAPAAKPKTIRCTKGKVSKQVTGTRCPAGWKKA